jgi:SpoVK/Ycf46/Vps4 family AAA+-type ATPase
MNDDRIALLELIRSSAAGQPDKVRDLALSLAEDARAGGDEFFAKEVFEAYEVRRDLPIGLYPLKAKKSLDQLNLPESVAKTIAAFLEEQRSRDILLAGRMEPRHKALLIGPPGNGKTVLAGAVSIALGVPSYMVRYDDLISKQPGETSRNLLTLFNYARERDCLLFFDEFDALGRERGDAQETGEMKRVTSTLLVQIDDIPAHVVCMAATNHAQMLDAAIWRRFNIRIELPRPALDQFPRFMTEYAESKGYPIDMTRLSMSMDIIAYRAMFENFSDAELFINNTIRTQLLSRGQLTLEQAVMQSLKEWTSGQKKVLG